jgi:hypothetical protein
VRQLLTAKQMSVVDSARFMALAAIGINDGIIAVLDAKYHYNFWRPITAIRNGDIDGNPATDREATWQPIVCRSWHRLVLRTERVTQPTYVRLDEVVWRYVLFAFVFLLLERGTLLISALLALNLAIEADPSTRILIDEVLAAPAATGATMAVGLLVLPRLSLVMPALALGERLSLRHAWRITRGNTLRLGAATALCILPAVTLATMVPLLMLLVRAHWWLDFSWPQIVALMWAWRPVWDLAIQLWQSLAYAVFVGIAYPVLTIFGVTLLSLTYRFFAVPTTEVAASKAVDGSH